MSLERFEQTLKAINQLKQAHQAINSSNLPEFLKVASCVPDNMLNNFLADCGRYASLIGYLPAVMCIIDLIEPEKRIEEVKSFMCYAGQGEQLKVQLYILDQLYSL
jgi:hypothetical protein